MKLSKEFVRYLIVGGISCVIDFTVLLILRQVLFPTATPLVTSLFSGVSFAVSFVFNYYASLKFVFVEHESTDTKKEFIMTLAIALIGLLLTIMLMYIFQVFVGVNYIIAKIIVTGIVLFWNYIARKVFVFK